MSTFTKYDVLMKILEIIDKDPVNDFNNKRTLTIIEKVNGNYFQEIKDESTSIVIENVSGDVKDIIISTKSNIIQNVEKIRKTHGDQLADSILDLSNSIIESNDAEFSEDQKAETLQLMEEFTKKATSKSNVKPILKSLGNSIWEAIKNVDSISKTAGIVWPIISKFLL